MQAPAGEKQGKILRFRPATLQHGGTGVVEGVVGGVVLRLPAALYQHAIAAGLLGGVVEDHRRVFAPLCGAGAEHGVIQVAKGRRPLSGGGFCRHGRHSLRQRRRIRQDAQPLFRRQRVGHSPHRRLIQHRPRPVHVQRQRHRRRAQAEGGGLQHAGSSPQQGSRQCAAGAYRRPQKIRRFPRQIGAHTGTRTQRRRIGGRRAHGAQQRQPRRRHAAGGEALHLYGGQRSRSRRHDHQQMQASIFPALVQSAGHRRRHGGRRHAQRPLSGAAAHQIHRLHQQQRQRRQQRSEALSGVHFRVAEGHVGTVDQHGRGGEPQPRLEIEKHQRADTCAQQRP